MLIGQKGVRYGLTVPKQKQKAASKPPNKSIFGDEDSDEEPKNTVEQQIARQAARKQTDKKVAELHAAALAEDASIFDYDAHYEDIQQARLEPKKHEKVQRSSKYIASLLEKAEERKVEQSILYERQLAKERAAEDHLFGDKERFITAAYKKKLEEDQKWLEEEKKKKAQEECEAVEKRGHMGDFYRNLFRQNVAFGAKPTKQAKAEQAGNIAQQESPEQPLEPDWDAPDIPATATGQTEAMASANYQRKSSSSAHGGHAAREASSKPAGSDATRASGEDREEGKDAPLATHRTMQGEQQRSAPVVDGDVLQEVVGAGDSNAKETMAAADISLAKCQGTLVSVGDGAGGTAVAEAGQRRNREDAVAAARERYLARKRKAGQA